MVKLGRLVVIGLGVAWAAVFLFTLVHRVEARTANAVWECGSLLDPRTHAGGLARGDTPVEAELMFIAGEAACASRRDQQQGDALRLLFPAALLGISARTAFRADPVLARREEATTGS